MTTDTQVWFELEYSVKGANDWFAVGNTSADTPEAINQKLTAMAGHPAYEYRAVKKTLVTETIS